jgi:hypothetical protein
VTVSCPQFIRGDRCHGFARNHGRGTAAQSMGPRRVVRSGGVAARSRLQGIRGHSRACASTGANGRARHYAAVSCQPHTADDGSSVGCGAGTSTRSTNITSRPARLCCRATARAFAASGHTHQRATPASPSQAESSSTNWPRGRCLCARARWYRLYRVNTPAPRLVRFLCQQPGRAH